MEPVVYFGAGHNVTCLAQVAKDLNHLRDNRLQIEVAKFSHIGNRDENQDRVEILVGDHTVVAIVVDGMGGHAAGAAAAITTIATISARFKHSKKPLPFPERFLARAIGEAHDALVRMGKERPIDDRPRATCAIGLVQGDTAIWAHVGDSRVYLLRAGQVVERTRDHTHVEMLLQEGLIDEADIAAHPMRSFVDQCLGGDVERPPVTIGEPYLLHPDDTLFACSDGVWTGLSDEQLAAAFAQAPDAPAFAPLLEDIVTGAVERNEPASDNASATAIRWVGDDPN